MKEVKDKIVFICLAQEIGGKLSKAFADSLGMFFADCKELIEYDLFNSGQVLSECGEEYYLMRERKVIATTCRYENAVMFSNFDIFSHNKELFNKYSTKVFLKVPKKFLTEKDLIDKLAYDLRNKELEESCDLTVNIKSESDKTGLKEIYKVLGGLS